jgi:hypothetical protein
MGKGKIEKGNVFCENCKYYKKPISNPQCYYMGGYPCNHKENRVEIKTALQITYAQMSIFEANNTNNCKYFEERQEEK